MKIREVNQKAENLIEQGENAKQRQIHYQQATNSARSQLMAAYARLEAASETDEDGEPVGDVAGAQAEVYAAQAFLASAESGLMEATHQLEGINQQKLDAVQEIEQYESVEEHNLSILAQLQKKQFGTNAAAFMADLAAKMNSSEQMRQQLLQSMGMSASAKSFSAAGGSGVAANMGSNTYTEGPSDQWMNQFNASEMRASLTPHEYKQRLADYRRGLARELGEARANRLTDAEVEELSIHRNSYTKHGQPFDTAEYVRNNFVDVISDGNYLDHKNPNEYNPSNPGRLAAFLSGGNVEKRRISFEDDNNAAQQWCDKNFKNPFSKEELPHIENYSCVGYSELNKALYTGKQLSTSQQEMTKHLDSAISRNTLNDDVVVYRAVDKKAMQSFLGGRSLSKGLTFTADAYSSTSVCSNNRYLQTRPNLEYVFKLTAKAGTPAASLEKVTSVPGEYELLFGRGSQYYVTNVYRGKRADISDQLYVQPDKDVVIIEGYLF